MKPPYPRMNPSAVAVDVIEKNLGPEIPPSTLPLLAELMKRCWAAEPEVRPPITYVIEKLVFPEYHFPGTNEAEFESEAALTAKYNHKRTGSSSQSDHNIHTPTFSQVLATIQDTDSSSREKTTNFMFDEISAKLDEYLQKDCIKIIGSVLNEASEASQHLMTKLRQLMSQKYFRRTFLKFCLLTQI